MKKLVIILTVFFSSTLVFAQPQLQGTYEVPVTNPELKPFSIYTVKSNQDAYETGDTHFEFSLPLELVGKSMNIKMDKVTGETNTWRGPNVEGQCTDANLTFNCSLRFRNLEINDSEVKKVVQSTFEDPAEAEGRLAVALAFSSEPIGILQYRKKEK